MNLFTLFKSKSGAPFSADADTTKDGRYWYLSTQLFLMHIKYVLTITRTGGPPAIVRLAAPPGHDKGKKR